MSSQETAKSFERPTTLTSLTEHDADVIAKAEQEAYPEGDLVFGRGRILEILETQKRLDAPEILSSFAIYREKELTGYVLMLPEHSEIDGKRVLYIHDMAVLPKFRGFTVAMKMMERVLDASEEYDVAIEAEARANTTYTLLMNDRVQAWLKGRGFEITRSEKLPEYLGGEDFYLIRIERKH